MASYQHRLTELLSTNTESTTEHPVPKIQRVQPYIRERNAKYYSPKLVSIGPIHHREKLLQGDKYKSMWAVKYLERISIGTGNDSRHTAEQLFQKIVDDLPTLKGYYTEDAIDGYEDEDIAWIFFLDGCAVLYFLKKAASIESLRELKIKAHQLMILQHDLLLLENQLPFRVLRLLISNDNECKLNDYIEKFLEMHNMTPDRVQGKDNTTGTHNLTQPDEVHLLHLLRNAIIGKNSNDRIIQERRGVKSWPTHRIIQELMASRIRIKKHKKNDARLININFETVLHLGGKLYLSKLVVDDSTAPILLNLIAYEMCPDFENLYEISSYVSFLDSLISLIDHADDVKDLRKAGILRNVLGSDEEVTTLFNTIITDLVPDEEIYKTVRDKIEAHYKKKHKTWMAQAYYDYLSNPWTFIAITVVFIALALTFVQTWFTVYSSHNS